MGCGPGPRTGAGPGGLTLPSNGATVPEYRDSHDSDLDTLA